MTIRTSRKALYQDTRKSAKQVANYTKQVENTGSMNEYLMAMVCRLRHISDAASAAGADSHHVAEHVPAAVAGRVTLLAAEVAYGRQRTGGHHVAYVVTAATSVGDSGKLEYPNHAQVAAHTPREMLQILQAMAKARNLRGH